MKKCIRIMLTPHRVFIALSLSTLCTLVVPIALSARIVPVPTAPVHVNYSVIVCDKDQNTPLELARVILQRGSTIVAGKVTNALGKAVFKDLNPGLFILTIHSVGYVTFVDTITIDPNHTLDSVALSEVGQGAITVTASNSEAAIPSLEPKSGNQTLETEKYHPVPGARMTQLVQENVVGVPRAPTGEIHVRGQHGELTYYIDGMPIPMSVFGGLNEIVEPKVIDRLTFMTGGFPAEYGGQMAAIMEIQTRVPTGHLQFDFETYAGSYLVFNGAKAFSPGAQMPSGSSSTAAGDTIGGRVGPFRALNTNGQSIAISDHIGNLGFYFSGSRDETDHRIDLPTPILFNDHGFDYFLYGKADYILGDHDLVTTNLNWSRTNTQVPFDPAKGILLDVQQATNSFQTLTLFHTFSSEIDHEQTLLVGGFVREGSLTYTPGLGDLPETVFAPDTITKYNLAIDRSFTSYGFRTKYEHRLSHEVLLATGIVFSATSGNEDFSSFNAAGKGPSPSSSYKGSDFGAFVQTELHPEDWTSFELGLRYDQHIAPDQPLTSALSPRIKWNFIFDEADHAYLYWGKMFMPTNIEGLQIIANATGSEGKPTAPERDNFFEGVFTRNWDLGLTSKLAGFYKISSPGVDDQTVGSSALKTTVNIETVHVAGIELALHYAAPNSPFSTFGNIGLTHAYGQGNISGGFRVDTSGGAITDLDHDQRLSVEFGINYQPEDWFTNITANYGSGLTNGNPSNIDFATGLFDFNQAAHATPSWIFDVSAGYKFHLSGSQTLEPSLYITNLFDHDHLVKGSYFSGASWEDRRRVTLRLKLHV